VDPVSRRCPPGIVKTSGPVEALDGVDLDLYRGEVLAMIGDNGAGKSTLIKCLAGAEIPDLGEIRVNGKECNVWFDPRSPKNCEGGYHA